MKNENGLAPRLVVINNALFMQFALIKLDICDCRGVLIHSRNLISVFNFCFIHMIRYTLVIPHIHFI